MRFSVCRPSPSLSLSGVSSAVLMGSKRKSKEEKKNEGKSKRRRTEEQDEGSRSKKSDRNEKRHKHRSDKEKKSKDDHKGKHRKRDQQLKHDNFQELSTEDYFLKNNEFATWLKEEKDVFFSNLSSESARSLFKDFIKEWNSQNLESRYYEGISSGPRTAHNWKIRK